MESVSKIICDWNPIGVPRELCISEYSELIHDLEEIIDDLNEIEKYLLHTYEIRMGLELNEDSIQQIKLICRKVYQSLLD
ncbi:MAG TPA: hypothetical protein DDY18_02945 [Flavobacterium sp.]|nr:hypothetical protein [Flavobacterium sp.]